MQNISIHGNIQRATYSYSNINNVNFISAEVEGEHKGIFGLLKLSKELKKLNITHIADLHNVLRSKIIRSFFKLGK